MGTKFIGAFYLKYCYAFSFGVLDLYSTNIQKFIKYTIFLLFVKKNQC